MLYYAQGDAIITEDELFEEGTHTKLSQFYADLEAERKPAPIRFSTGTLDLDNVISIDGTPHEELISFTPTAASAAILSRFFGIKDGQAQPFESLLDAIKLYNDFGFRQQIERLDKQIDRLPDGG